MSMSIVATYLLFKEAKRVTQGGGLYMIVTRLETGILDSAKVRYQNVNGADSIVASSSGRN